MAPPPPQLRLRLQYDLDGAVVGFLDTALLNAVYRRRVRAQRLGMGSAIAVGVAALGIQLTRAPWPEVFFSVYGFGLFVVCTLVVSFVAIGVGIQRKAVRFLRFDLRGFRLQGVDGDGALREWTDVTEIAGDDCTIELHHRDGIERLTMTKYPPEDVWRLRRVLEDARHRAEPAVDPVEARTKLKHLLSEHRLTG